MDEFDKRRNQQTRGSGKIQVSECLNLAPFTYIEYWTYSLLKFIAVQKMSLDLNLSKERIIWSFFFKIIRIKSPIGILRLSICDPQYVLYFARHRAICSPSRAAVNSFRSRAGVELERAEISPSPLRKLLWKSLIVGAGVGPSAHET